MPAEIATDHDNPRIVAEVNIRQLPRAFAATHGIAAECATHIEHLFAINREKSR
ncbi:hypothetical protein OIE68_10675 [Nocardia vinacea]|uniref:Uncharacterized protein n=1 Tax=Nocardia vinacea TaxID=96468 RepID=A0ABZ1YVM3_9NOCA|nr:hypothetical protein OIE68_10675 [Nocardia vinacea]